MAGPLRAVVAVPRPGDLAPFDAEGEWALVASELQPLVAAGRLTLERCIPASEAAVRLRLGRPCDVLHLIAHAQVRDGHSSLVLEGRDGRARVVTTQFFTQILQAARSPCTVILQSPRGFEGPFVRAATSFAARGPVRVVSVGEVRPGCLAFYAALAEGRSVAEAAGRSLAWVDSFDAETPADTAKREAAWQGPPRNGPPINEPPAPPPAPARDTSLATPSASLEPSRVEVFLCHNWADKPAVRSIAARLAARGVAPWLDEQEMRPGDLWQSSLEATIERVEMAVVFVGSSGIGRWQRLEIDALQRKFVDGGRIIPVKLESFPEGMKLPLFLEGRLWVDFHDRERDPIEQLVRGITGRR